MLLESVIRMVVCIILQFVPHQCWGVFRSCVLCLLIGHLQCWVHSDRHNIHNHAQQQIVGFVKVIWHDNRSWSSLVQLMAWCLNGTNLLNQWCYTISEKISRSKRNYNESISKDVKSLLNSPILSWSSINNAWYYNLKPFLLNYHPWNKQKYII